MILSNFSSCLLSFFSSLYSFLCVCVAYTKHLGHVCIEHCHLPGWPSIISSVHCKMMQTLAVQTSTTLKPSPNELLRDADDKADRR